MKEHYLHINKLLSVLLSMDIDVYNKQINNNNITLKQIIQFEMELEKFINKLNI